MGFMGERSLGLWIQQNSQNWPWSHLHVPQRPPRHLQGSTAVRVGTYACVYLVHSREDSRIRGTSSSQLSHRPAPVGACGLAVLIPHLSTTVHHHTQASLYTSLTQRPSVLSQWGLSCSLRSDLYSLTAQADLPNLSFSL